MDTYENPSAPVEYRVEHLLSQMTLEEKVGQMLTSLGWPMYERVGEDIRLTPQLEKRNRRVPYRIALGFYAG